MARPLRIEYENAFYHVICRGDHRQAIFTCDRDKEMFLRKLGETAEKFQLVVHAYVLMGNHYHILIETPLANLSRAMHDLNAGYSNWFRFKYQVTGSVFQGRYKAVLVEKDAYLKVLSAYIHLNPVRAGIVRKPSVFRFSSCRYYITRVKPPAFLKTGDLLGIFGDRGKYARFINSFPKAGKEIAPDDIYGKNSLLGSDGFLRKAMKKANKSGKTIDAREQPEARQAGLLEADDIMEIMIAGMRIPEDEIWNRKRGNVYRKLLIHGLRRYTVEGLREIGKILDMDYSAVSAMARRFENEVKEKKEYRRLAERLAEEVAQRRMTTTK